ncbi:MAG: hypothetical protein KGH87_01095 [Thaumarchaeota archaeon]|nr:hypothetical protein [Nitrososphaerota archaeon]MDE1838492.1 hypothetical protein [Nitrososphaerota archaeon]
MNKQTIRRVLNAYGKAINEIHAQGMALDEFDEKDITGMVQDILNHPHQHRSES